jgi:hypothetical protein
METAAKSLTDRSHGPITPHAPPQFHKRAATVSLPRVSDCTALSLLAQAVAQSPDGLTESVVREGSKMPKVVL